MAAGLGFKDFTTGEVLTAADVDGYLMQGVWVFASAAARDAVVTSPQEGNFAYLKDTNVTTYYTGSAWANLDTTGMTNPMTTTGDTIYSSSGSTPARLGIGSTGQVLTVSGGVPSWATPAGGLTSGNSYVSTSESTTSTSYTSLTTADSVTLTTGTKALILFTAELWTSTASRYAAASISVSGASTVTASDNYYMRAYVNSGGASNRYGMHTVLTGLTAGSNTFSMKYCILGGAGTTEARYRSLTVIDLGS